jgi:hypothetical protein
MGLKVNTKAKREERDSFDVVAIMHSTQLVLLSRQLSNNDSLYPLVLNHSHESLECTSNPKSVTNAKD